MKEKGIKMMVYKEVKEKSVKREIVSSILDHLPDWFGIEESKREYVEESMEMPLWAAYENEIAVGFIVLKQHNQYSAEIYVMGVEVEYHRKGIGKLLFKQCCEWCKNNSIEYLQVKTLDESRPDINYEKTRNFYKALGFRPVECFKTLWDEYNPCLQMIMKIS